MLQHSETYNIWHSLHASVLHHRALDTTAVTLDQCKEKHILLSKFKSTVCFCWGVFNGFPTENLVVLLHVVWLTLRRPLVGCICCVILLWKEKHTFMWHVAKKGGEGGSGSCVGVTMNICAEKMCNGQLCKDFSFQNEWMTWLDLDTDHQSHANWQWSKLSECEINSNQIKYCLTLGKYPKWAVIHPVYTAGEHRLADRQLHQPFMKSDSQELKDAHTQTCTYWKRNISHLLFGYVAAESHGNQIQRGEKSGRWQTELHRSGSRAQTLKSHDKNNIPHLSDSLQGIRVKRRHFSACIPHCIKTICCNVWMWILLQVRVGAIKTSLGLLTQGRLQCASACKNSCML